MKKLFSILLFIVFISSLCFSQDTSELKKKIQTMCDEYSQKMIAGDMSTLWPFYSDDIISMPSYEPTLRGLDAVKSSYDKMNESGMKMTKFALTVTDVLQSGDFVVEIGTYTLTMEGGMLPAPWDDHGKYMNLWETQDDGSMKLKVETWNTDVNPWMEMQKSEEMEGHEEHK
jgi:ketosteroid isomerase-like protein